MITDALYQQSSRIQPSHESKSVGLQEITWLLSAGITAAALSCFLKLHLSIPGHAILKVVLPFALGFAAVPCRSAGTIMGSSALCSALMFRQFAPIDEGLGIGSLTSLLLFGPILDLCSYYLRRSGSTWLVLALAGLITNTGAFLVRGVFIFWGKDLAIQRLFANWFSVAIFSYAICGLLAGLICGVIFFRIRPEPSEIE